MAGRYDSKTAREILCDALAGASSGKSSLRFLDSCRGSWRWAIAATFVCPLDVIKTRLQVHGLPEIAPSSSRRTLASPTLCPSALC
ncbi:hypothetical protein B296_00033772 [Ensete ventricosum]|uniref:Uncharacterized protein n=1 Tax=Ensete ventricosum TaxID=4639 RepID=A0A426ZTJ6_ENSVE|nr:hypothetical protein B296_00033772 [Ensete ventricosum]